MTNQKLPSPPKELGRAVRDYGAQCWIAGSNAALQEQAKLLGMLADLHAAAGDPESRLTHDELIERIRQLADRAIAADADQAQEAAKQFLPRPRKLRGTSIDIDGALALYTESDVLGCLALAYQSGRLVGRRDDIAAIRAADDQRIGEEEERWADWRRGAGPKPGSTR